MSPQIEAALIAGIVSLISLGGTVVVALKGFQAAKSTTKETLEAQREQLERTLEEQHVRTLNDRFATAAEKLGNDKPPPVRLAGVYAMAGLADDWDDNRQACIDVLCGYLRMPYARDPGEGEARLGFLADREVRHTVIRVITDHLRESAKKSWRGRDFDFTNVVFDGGDFSQARFSGGMVRFGGAEFTGGTVDFHSAEFTGGTVDFHSAEFTGGTVDFHSAKFTGATVDFHGAEFTGGTVDFSSAEFSGGRVDFSYAGFSGSTVEFGSSKFTGAGVSFGGAEFFRGRVSLTLAEFFRGRVGFRSARFSGGTVDFGFAKFSGATVGFRFAEFTDGTADFGNAEFTDGTVDFGNAKFSGATVDFGRAKFTGATVDFGNAKFTGATVDFRLVSAWLHPPQFDWDVDAVPPEGVMRPTESGDTPKLAAGVGGALDRFVISSGHSWAATLPRRDARSAGWVEVAGRGLLAN